MVRFFKSVAHEMKMVVWPTGKQWRKDVLVVIEMTIIFALFFALSDFGVSNLIKLFVQK